MAIAEARRIHFGELLDVFVCWPLPSLGKAVFVFKGPIDDDRDEVSDFRITTMYGEQENRNRVRNIPRVCSPRIRGKWYESWLECKTETNHVSSGI
jgi:hypothetical protein